MSHVVLVTAVEADLAATGSGCVHRHGGTCRQIRHDRIGGVALLHVDAALPVSGSIQFGT